jgi:hypothetical protein
MSQENVDLLRRAYEAFNGRDPDAMLALAHDDVVVESRRKVHLVAHLSERPKPSKPPSWRSRICVAAYAGCYEGVTGEPLSSVPYRQESPGPSCKRSTSRRSKTAGWLTPSFAPRRTAGLRPAFAATVYRSAAVSGEWLSNHWA